MTINGPGYEAVGAFAPGGGVNALLEWSDKISERILTSTMRNEHMKPADRLKASEMLAKTYGAFLERVEVART